MKPYELASDIRQRVTIADAIALYAPNPLPRRNRIPCPIHGGENYNLSFTRTLYHCFVCGDGGDVISFVMHIFDIPFNSAIKKLNDDFALGLPIGIKATLRDNIMITKRKRAIDAARSKAQREKDEYKRVCNDLLNKWVEYDKNLRELAPKSIDEELDPRWVEACKNIDLIACRLDGLALQGGGEKLD